MIHNVLETAADLFFSDVRCPDPGVPKNGERVGNNFTYGEEVRFRCHGGYRLFGVQNTPSGDWSSPIRCTGDGTWSSIVPYCMKNSSKSNFRTFRCICLE